MSLGGKNGYWILYGSDQFVDGSKPVPAKTFYLKDKIIKPGHSILIVHSYADVSLYNLADYALKGLEFNGDDWVALAKIEPMTGDFNFIDVIGDMTAKAPSRWDADNYLANHYLKRTTREEDRDYARKWTQSEWKIVRNEAFEQEQYTEFAYHLDPNYVCTTHDACPEQAFCDNRGLCETCEKCALDKNAIDEKCPKKCPAKCEEEYPRSDICPYCDNKRYTTPGEIEFVPDISGVGATYATISWWEKDDMWKGKRADPNSMLVFDVSFVTDSGVVIMKKSYSVRASDTEFYDDDESGDYSYYAYNITSLYPFQSLSVAVATRQRCITPFSGK